jgi:hypothetical protein
MYWSQNIVVFILFPYLLPSVPLVALDCWPKEKFRCVLEYILLSACDIGLDEIQDALKMFVKQTFRYPSYKPSLDKDLCFLADMSQRYFFEQLISTNPEVYCLYGCSFLIENKLDIHQNNGAILKYASRCGYKDVVDLLLKHKANVHVDFEYPLRYSSAKGHMNIVALLLQHKADIHENNFALGWASHYGHIGVVDLLLQQKANVHAYNNNAIVLASQNGHTNVVDLLLQHKADASSDNPLRWAVRNGHEDTVDLLIEHKADVRTLDVLESASFHG